MIRRLALLAAILIASAPGRAETVWHEAKTHHFVVYSDQKPEVLRDYVTRLEKFDSAVRAVRKMTDPPLSDANRLTVYVLRDQAAIATLYGSQSVAGFYLSRVSGPVAFVHREVRGTRGALEAETVFFHEYLHHLMLQELDAAYPAWMVEGYAEFFATAEFAKDGSVGFGAAAHHRGYFLKHVAGLSLTAMLGGRYFKLTGAEVESIYGQGWLLTHYLAFEPSRRGQVSRYVADIQKGRPALEAAKAAFGDLKQLDRELGQYLSRKTLPFQSIPASQIRVGPIAIRPLTEGESAILSVRMRSKRGVDRTGAKTVAGSARRVAARYPGVALVQTSLAEAELDSRNFEGAVAAADRAIAIDPRSIEPLLLKGRALMALAKVKSAKTDWKAIRSLFVRANRLDLGAAEPLVLFYETFGEEGTTPTKSAVEGLLYALDLVPQDSDLRRQAVRQLLVDGRVVEAKAAFGPIAYSVHVGRQHEKYVKIMDAIEAGDTKTAIAMIDTEIAERKRDT